MVGTKGLEPSTSRFRTVRSSQLSYVPIAAAVYPTLMRAHAVFKSHLYTCFILTISTKFRLSVLRPLGPLTIFKIHLLKLVNALLVGAGSLFVYIFYSYCGIAHALNGRSGWLFKFDTSIFIFFTYYCLSSNTIKQYFVPSYTDSLERGYYDGFVKSTSHRTSLPLVLMHVAFIAFLSLSMVMSIPTLR
jgi:hypothetical protein